MRTRPSPPALPILASSRALVLAAAIAALALAGCGDDPGNEATSTGSATTAAPADVSELRERFNDAVGELLADRGLDETVSECALAELGGALGDKEIEAATQEIRQTGIAPPEVIDAAAAAGEACSGE